MLYIFFKDQMSEASFENDVFYQSSSDGENIVGDRQQQFLTDDDSDATEQEINVDGETYDEIFEELKIKWLVIENQHRISKRGSESFWRAALKFFPKLKSAPGNKKTQQFKTIRRNLYKDKLPEISLQIGYKHRTTGEIKVVTDTFTHRKQYSPSEYEKLYEIGTIKVKYNYVFFFPQILRSFYELPTSPFT